MSEGFVDSYTPAITADALGVAMGLSPVAPVLSEVLTPGHEGVTFHEPGQLESILLALATADLSTTRARPSMSGRRSRAMLKQDRRIACNASPLVTGSSDVRTHNPPA